MHLTQQGGRKSCLGIDNRKIALLGLKKRGVFSLIDLSLPLNPKLVQQNFFAGAGLKFGLGIWRQSVATGR